MKRKFLFAVILLFCVTAFAECVQIKNVAVVETQIDECSSAVGEVNRAEVTVITNEIRRERLYIGGTTSQPSTPVDSL